MSDQPIPVNVILPFPHHPTVSALRADDFLLLEFEFVNLQVSTPSPGKPVLTIVNTANPAFIIVTFPPQNIAEQGFWLAADGFPVSPPPGRPLNPPTTETPAKYMAADGPFLDGHLRPVALSRIAGASRLAFTVPANTGPIPYSLQSLLEKCSELPLSIAPTAVAPPPLIINIHLAAAEALRTAIATPMAAPSPAASAARPAALPISALMVQHRAALQAGRSLTFKIASGAIAANNIPKVAVAPPPLVAPTATQTAIEMPYRLIISPNQYGAWVHASTPVISQAGRTELWHTRLGSRIVAAKPIDESAGTQHYFRNFSAIWARHPDPEVTANKAPPHDQIQSTTSIPFRTSLDAFDRWYIVHQSYDHSDIVTNRMMLTSLGGWLDAFGTWNKQEIEEWRHVATMGRDHYARVVYEGFLFPFGHRASLVKITERIFHPGLPGNPAYLRQRVFVVVREHEKFYHQNAPALTDAGGARFDLQMPFQRVRITTMVTPNLDPPPGGNLSCFCPQVGRADFKFHLVAEALDGSEIEFSAPLYFVDISPQGDVAPGRMPDHLDNLILDFPKQRGVCDFQGRRVPFAEGSDPNKPSDVKPGSTTFETASVTFSATRLDDHHQRALAWECHFYPKVTATDIVVPALKHLARNSGPVRVSYDNAVYLRHGFDRDHNKGQVFLRMASPENAAVLFSGQGDRSGGLATPDMQMTALSRLLGPVAGDASKISQGNFDPADFFKALDGALLFGTIPLTAVLKAVGLDDPSKLPRFVTEGMSKLDGLLQDVAAAQDLVKTVSGEIDSAAAALGAKAAVLKSDAAVAATDLDALAMDLQNLVKDPKSAAKDFVQHLETFVSVLQKLLSDLPPLDAVADGKRSLQKILSRFRQEVAGAESIIDTLLAEQLTIKFVWNPVIQSWSLSPGSDPLFVPNQPDGFKISVEMQVAKTGAEPAMDIYCGLRDFKVQLIPPIGTFVTLHFDVLEFTVATGKSPDVNVKLNSSDGITFGGPLSFVNTLENLIPLNGFSDPPALSVTPQGIFANYSVGLPTVGIGVFSLQNISLGAGFRVPFVVDPLELDFNFCTREQPFLLTVSLFGGGGYFRMAATPNGLYFEAALEFGAAVSINLGVASGGVHVMAGIMFATNTGTREVTLDGFLRMGGNVDVLGIISVSIELDMDLKYSSDPESNSVIGEATITVEVSVLFFHEGVSISCQKQFAGSPAPAHAQARMAHLAGAPAVGPGGTAPTHAAAPTPPPPPPTFKDLMQRDTSGAPWRDYCRAFA